MGRKGHLQGLLVQKEEQIALLESRIQAYTGRISLLQSRLLATLDTLDVIQTNQAHELSSAARTQAGLREQLDEYKKVVESAELERDDLRDAVGKLIKKVEESNDCKNWPHSRISLSSLPDPLSLTYRKQARSNDEEELLAYATAMVDALRRERDAERRAHAQTQEQAEARILALEAKLSRREAELEAYVVGDGQDRSEVETEPEQITPRVKPRVLFEGGVIADDQITALFDETVARNKRLESEITTLYRRLEKARTKRSESRSDAVPFLSSPTSNTAPTAGQTRLSQEAAYLNSSNASSASNTAALPMHYMPREDPQTPTDGSRVRDESFRDPDANNEVLRSLQHQIMLLGEKIDIFANERNVLSETLSHNQYERPRQPSDASYAEMEDSDVSQETHLQSPRFHEQNPDLERCLQCLENGCASLQASADALRDELAITRQVAQARETTLIDAINELRLALFTCAAPPLSEPVEHESEPEQMHQTENVPPPTVPHHDPPPTNIGVHDRYGSRAVDDHHHHDALRAPVEGDAESDGEVSMELATPLVALVDIPPSPTASASGSHGDGTEDELLMDHGRGSESGDRWALVPADHLVGAERRNQDRDLYTGHPGQHVVDDSPNDPGGAETEDEGKGYVDPPSIQLPPSPGVEAAQLQADAYDRDAERENYSPDGEEEEDIVDADSPTLSHPLPGLMDPHVHTNNHSRSLYHATSSFVAELRHVEQEMALSQVQLDEGVIALARVEERVDELVAELDLP